MKIPAVISIFLLCGCVSVPNSPNPRFYMLKSIDNSQLLNKSDAVSNVIIEVGPVRIPEYLDRPQIVTQDKNRMVNFAQFDRWGEPLDQGLGRVILEGLNMMLPGATIGIFPFNRAIPVNYQVIVDVIAIESDLNNDIVFLVQWSLINAKNNRMFFTRRYELRKPVEPHNYSGLVYTLSSECASLSSDIANAIVLIENKRRQ